MIWRVSAGAIVVAATILASCSHRPQTVVGAFEKLGSECSPIAQKGVASSFVCSWRGDKVLVEALTPDQWIAYRSQLRTLCGAGGFIPNPMLTDGSSLHITVGSDPPTPIGSLARSLHDAGLDLQEVTDCGLVNGDLSGA